MSQHVIECPDHDECAIIYADAEPDAPYIEVGRHRAAWASHQSHDVEPAHRLNLDYPEATDRRFGRRRKLRWSLPPDHQARLMGLDPERHALLAAHGVARFLVDGGQAATVVDLPREVVDEAAHALLAASADLDAGNPAEYGRIVDDAEAKAADIVGGALGRSG